MNQRRFLHNNRSYYARYYKLIAVAVLLVVGVITGSLVVGDSVRATLGKRVNERLGDTETIVFSRNAYLSDEILQSLPFRESARGILLVNGFVSHSGKLLPVFVWGVEDQGITTGNVNMNTALANEISPSDNPDIVLRLPSTGLVPSGSLFVTKNYTTSLRLSFDRVVEAVDGGNVSMKNEQIIPFNVFVNRQELADVLGVTGKINLVFSAKSISTPEFTDAWKYTHSGLSIKHKADFTEITSDRIFIQDDVLTSVSNKNGNPNRLFSYLANTIGVEDKMIPYSFVTAIDYFGGEALLADEVILSDYSAARLNARVGQEVEITYYTSDDFKRLLSKSIRLKVKKIVPIAVLQADSTLSADFPGLSDVERCTDWDSDLPIEMNLITDEDEKYWEQYRSTPKAVVAYNAVASDWSNAYGTATALRVTDTQPNFDGLTAEMFGVQLIYPRESAIYAAKNGVDFSGLFLALGFFILVSAMLLFLTPLSEMLFTRREEIDLLKALGYPRRRIVRLLWVEAMPVVLLSSLAGIVAGLVYTNLIMWLLGNVWQGATQTDGFSTYPSATTLLLGLAVGSGASLWLLYLSVNRSLKGKKAEIRGEIHPVRTRRRFAILSTALAIATISINFILFQSVVLFVIVGIVSIVTAYLWGDYLVCSKASASGRGFHSGNLFWNSLSFNKKQVSLSFFALTTGVFIVFSTGLNRRGFADGSQIKAGTGGYSLWVESAVPVYHNLLTEEGRSKLSLSALPAGTEVIQCLRYSADDASCLNLHKVSTPTVLGVDMHLFAESDFLITQSIPPFAEAKQKKGLSQRTGSVYPALVDETVLTWGLMMAVGDTLYYEGGNGKTVALRIAGTLANSIFQGNILIDRNLFKEIWPENTGSEVFLVKVDKAGQAPVKELLSQALHEYGVTVSTTTDRLKQFNAVTDTYLTIFLTLGGIGLVLGIMSFVIVVRKSLVMRQDEIELYGTLGFPKEKTAHILYMENILVPLYAILTGVVSSLIGVSISFRNTTIQVWVMALLFTLLFIACVLVFVRQTVNKEVLQESDS